MDKQKNVIFSTALNGYKKQDVNAFIASLNANFSAAEEGYRREIGTLKAELETLREQQAQNRAVSDELEALRTECDALKTELNARPTQIAIEENADEIAALRKKAALYDHMSSQLGDMMIAANHNAELIVDEARTDAAKSLAEVKSTIAQSAALLAGQLETLYRGANKRAIGEINANMQQAQRAMNQFLEDLTARRGRLEEMLRQNDADTRRTADEQIAKMLDQTQDAIAAIGAKPIETEAQDK